MRYWLLKSEPEVFGIVDLKNRPKKTEHWDGVRNYQARNFMRDEMKLGDLAFFYHSNCKEPGIVGVVEVVREAYPDFTAHDPESPYFDSRSTPGNPRWFMIDIRFKQQFRHVLRLEDLKKCIELDDMLLLRRGNRLSVMPIDKRHWQFIIRLSGDTKS